MIDNFLKIFATIFQIYSKAKSITISFDDDILLFTVCPIVGGIVKDGTCTCPPDQILSDKRCEGMYFVFG